MVCGFLCFWLRTVTVHDNAFPTYELADDVPASRVALVRSRAKTECFRVFGRHRDCDGRFRMTSGVLIVSVSQITSCGVED